LIVIKLGISFWNFTPPHAGGRGTYFPFSWKVGKEPRLSDICCKSTLYPVGAIQAVCMLVKEIKESAALLRIA